MQPHERVGRSRKKMVTDNFIGGIAWAVGVFVGGTIVVSILLFLFSKVDLVPVVGDFVLNVLENVAQKNPKLVE
ncbi:MAG: DUF5665 domain-containing protein [Candidatus Levyibacteriota bacterium]